MKCRSFVVVHQFTDEEVLSPNFGQTVMEVVKAAKPLVYWYGNDSLMCDDVDWTVPLA